MKDGYTYPELRYAVFDFVAFIWTIVGLWAAFLLLKEAKQNVALSSHASFAIKLFMALLGLLIGSVLFGMSIRGVGI